MRRITMLTIKDLPASKDLDCSEMAAVSGGRSQSAIGTFSQFVSQDGKGNVNTNVGVFVPVVTNVDVSDVGNVSNFLRQPRGRGF
jgi:hypothetical protein